MCAGKCGVIRVISLLKMCHFSLWKEMERNVFCFAHKAPHCQSDGCIERVPLFNNNKINIDNAIRTIHPNVVNPSDGPWVTAFSTMLRFVLFWRLKTPTRLFSSLSYHLNTAAHKISLNLVTMSVEWQATFPIYIWFVSGGFVIVPIHMVQKNRNLISIEEYILVVPLPHWSHKDDNHFINSIIILNINTGKWQTKICYAS